MNISTNVEKMIVRLDSGPMARPVKASLPVGSALLPLDDPRDIYLSEEK